MKISCKCGQVVGEIKGASKHTVTRAKCYCKDCQAASYLASEQGVLDENGGTEVYQTVPSRVSFRKGVEKLTCTRLSKKGIFRWAAGCCGTPMANTLPSNKFAFVSFVHTAVERVPTGTAKGPLHGARLFHVNTKAARNQSIKEVGRRRMIFKILLNVMKAKLTGSYKKNPFFDAFTGQPIVEPRILSPEENAALYNRLS